MKTVVPDGLAPGLTDKQIECLHILQDENWHDHKEIGRETKTYIDENISGRIIKPLERRGIVEQEERPENEGSRKMKKFVRMRTDIDAQSLHRLHLLIEYSANDMVMKFRGKNSERAKIFLGIRDESIKKLIELGKMEEERQQRLKEEYWKNIESSIPYSKSWPKLVAAAKLIADHFERLLEPLASSPLQSTVEKIREGIPYKALLAAADLNPELYKAASQDSRRHEWKEYYGIDADEWDRNLL